MSRPPGDAAPDGEGVPSTSEVAQVTETSSVGASIEVEPLTGTSAVESLRSQSISSSSSLFLQKDVLHSLTKSGQESLTQIVSGKDVEPEIWKSLLDEIFGKSEGCKTGDIQASFTRAGAKSIEPTLDAHETNKRTYEEGEVKVHIKENPLQIDVEGAQETRKYRNLDVEVDKGPAFISLAMPDYEGKDSGKSFVMSFTADGKIEKMNPPLEKIKIGKKDGMPYFEDGEKSIPIPLSKKSFAKFKIELNAVLAQSAAIQLEERVSEQLTPSIVAPKQHGPARSHTFNPVVSRQGITKKVMKAALRRKPKAKDQALAFGMESPMRTSGRGGKLAETSGPATLEAVIPVAEVEVEKGKPGGNWLSGIVSRFRSSPTVSKEPSATEKVSPAAVSVTRETSIGSVIRKPKEWSKRARGDFTGVNPMVTPGRGGKSDSVTKPEISSVTPQITPAMEIPPVSVSASEDIRRASPPPVVPNRNQEGGGDFTGIDPLMVRQPTVTPVGSEGRSPSVHEEMPSVRESATVAEFDHATPTAGVESVAKSKRSFSNPFKGLFGRKESSVTVGALKTSPVEEWGHQKRGRATSSVSQFKQATSAPQPVQSQDLERANMRSNPIFQRGETAHMEGEIAPEIPVHATLQTTPTMGNPVPPVSVSAPAVVSSVKSRTTTIGSLKRPGRVPQVGPIVAPIDKDSWVKNPMSVVKPASSVPASATPSPSVQIPEERVSAPDDPVTKERNEALYESYKLYCKARSGGEAEAREAAQVTLGEKFGIIKDTKLDAILNTFETNAEEVKRLGGLFGKTYPPKTLESLEVVFQGIPDVGRMKVIVGEALQIQENPLQIRVKNRLKVVPIIPESHASDQAFTLQQQRQQMAALLKTAGRGDMNSRPILTTQVRQEGRDFVHSLIARTTVSHVPPGSTVRPGTSHGKQNGSKGPDR